MIDAAPSPALPAWLEQAELLLSIDMRDGTRWSLSPNDERMAVAFPIWLKRLAEYMEVEACS